MGVRECTFELIRAFPGLHHQLFEPVSLFFDLIARNYGRIEHTLHPMALSDENSDAYIVLSALRRDGAVTHGHISSTPVEVDGQVIVECQPVPIRRFDDLDVSPADDYLLKVDVDGKDLNVLRGFGDKLESASVVMVEATHSTLLERAGYLAGRGFELFDLVDLVYYGPSLYQLDAVFLRRDLSTESVRPPIGNFDPEKWRPLAE